MKLGVQVGLGPGHIVLDGEPPPPKGAQPPIFAHVRFGQVAGWIKMPLGMEVGLGPGDFVLVMAASQNYVRRYSLLLPTE